MASSVLEVIPSSKSLIDTRMEEIVRPNRHLAFSCRAGKWADLYRRPRGERLEQCGFDSVWPYVLLGTALAIALGFEFVNGFHDTANAVATVIYTNSLHRSRR